MPLGDGGFRLSGDTWRLTPTPKARYPWLLVRGEDRREIGPANVTDALVRAEFSIETDRYFPPPPAQVGAA